jgi:Molybdopterin-binding domain of aldehyde dehydrogenase
MRPPPIAPAAAISLMVATSARSRSIPETGSTQVVGYWVVDDVGTVINPMLVKGQIMGGIAQGLGQVLMEDKSYDETGQVLTGSFMDYAMPRADNFCAVVIEDNPVPTPTNPLGVKGAGEAGTVGSLSAGVNAIVDALSVLGIKHIDTPCTPYRVWQAIANGGACLTTGVNTMRVISPRVSCSCRYANTYSRGAARIFPCNELRSIVTSRDFLDSGGYTGFDEKYALPDHPFLSVKGSWPCWRSSLSPLARFSTGRDGRT